MGVYENIKTLCEKNGIAPTALESKLGFGRGSIGKMKTGKTSADRLQKIADYFGVSVDFLMTGEQKPDYYLNDDTRELAQFLFDHPDYKVMFDAVRKVKKEDLEFIKELIDRTTN